MYAGPVRPLFVPPVTQLYSEEIHTMSFRFDVTSRVRNRVARALTCLALAAIALLPAARANAQTNTGAIRGYVRGAELWSALATRPVPELVHEILVLERACQEWMQGASELPTRYAF